MDMHANEMQDAGKAFDAQHEVLLGQLRADMEARKIRCDNVIRAIKAEQDVRANKYNVMYTATNRSYRTAIAEVTALQERVNVLISAFEVGFVK